MWGGKLDCLWWEILSKIYRIWYSIRLKGFEGVGNGGIGLGKYYSLFFFNWEIQTK